MNLQELPCVNRGEKIESLLFLALIYFLLVFAMVALSIRDEHKLNNETTFKKEFIRLAKMKNYMLQLFLVSLVCFVYYEFFD